MSITAALLLAYGVGVVSGMAVAIGMCERKRRRVGRPGATIAPTPDSDPRRDR